VGGKELVRVKIDLSKPNIQMFLSYIETALDTKHMQKQNEERIKEIRI
jgi:hypothetical protein